MKKYRKKPVVIKAVQWHGDFNTLVIRYPAVTLHRRCEYCRKEMRHHGWIDTLEGGHIVCPGDWIITGVKGEHYPCKPDIFAKLYDPVDEDKGPEGKPTPDANEIIKEYLRQEGFDGLYHPGDCACVLDKLMECGSYPGECMPGYLQPCPEDCGEHAFHIGPEKGDG
jgi:hypothetical protein